MDAINSIHDDVVNLSKQKCITQLLEHMHFEAFEYIFGIDSVVPISIWLVFKAVIIARRHIFWKP